MPTFEDVTVEISQKIDIDFEVFCGTCGSGICSESDTRKSRGRGCLQVTVNACPSCIEEKDSEISSLKSDIEEKESLIFELEQEIEKLKKQ